MTKKIPAGRFNSAADVHAAIDENRQRCIRLRLAASKLDESADEIFAEIQDYKDGPVRQKLCDKAIAIRERARGKRVHADNLEGQYATKLKSKAAIIGTELLPGTFNDNQDRSIPKR